MERHRYFFAALGAAALAGLALLLILFPPPGALAAQQAQASYEGVASCGGTTCHGRSEGDGRIVRQDEIRLWQDASSAAGAHSRAYAVLREARSQAIARRLGIGEAHNAEMCLGCHAAPAGPRGARFQLSDGVSCESCHGAASSWLASHYAVGGAHADNVRRGLVPLENPRARASVCLDCHFGSTAEGQFVSHRLMAAGHPRISFELDLFTTLQQHHQEDEDYSTRKGRIDNIQMWAVGQAMALERALSLFAGPRRGSDGVFPEFYFFDCHSCHRRISDDADFRPTAVANPGRPIPSGMPPWNDENIIMLAASLRVAAPQLAARFERDSRAFHAALTRDRGSAVSAANTLRETARTLATAFAGARFSRAHALAIIDSIASEAISPRFTDYAGSVQAVMAVDTLLSALVDEGAVSAAAARAIRADINAAYRAVRDPNDYSPGDFRVGLGRAAAAIRRLR